MSNEEGKRRAARAAMRFVEPGMIVGVGTGSTVAHFIDALAERRADIEATVSSSEQSFRCASSTRPASSPCTWTVPTSATRTTA